MKSAIYYTENRLDLKIAEACRTQLRNAFDGEIVCVSLLPLDFGDKRIVLPLERSYFTMFQEILAGLEAATGEIVYFTEHDVLYDSSHFDFIPPSKDKFYYDLNWWKVRKDGLAVQWQAVQVSGLVCYRDLAIKFYKERIASFDENSFDRKFEPTMDTEYETFWSSVPHIDIRHETNTTYNKWHIQHFRDRSTAVNFQESTVDKIPGWDNNVLMNILN